MSLIGDRFHRLVVIADAPRAGGHARYWVRCDCGQEKIVRAQNLVVGHSQSCGCRAREILSGRNRTTGSRGGITPKYGRAYKAWRDMHRRCHNPKHQRWKDYGGRGIMVEDPRWFAFESFLVDMGEPGEGLSLERKNNDIGYSKDNCMWATAEQQRGNKRNTHYITALGETLPLFLWAKRFAISSRTLRSRLCGGWSLEKALITPAGPAFKKGERRIRP